MMKMAKFNIFITLLLTSGAIATICLLRNLNIGVMLLSMNHIHGAIQIMPWFISSWLVNHSSRDINTKSSSGVLIQDRRFDQSLNSSSAIEFNAPKLENARFLNKNEIESITPKLENTHRTTENKTSQSPNMNIGMILQTMPPGDVLFSYGNRAHLPFHLHWLCNTAGWPDVHKRTLLAVQDQFSVDQIHKLSSNVKTFIVPESSKTYGFYSKGYRKLTIKRVQILVELLKTGRGVVMFEGDAVWLRNIMQDSNIFGQHRKHDFALYRDGPGGQNIGAGLMSMKGNSKGVLKIWTSVLEELTRDMQRHLKQPDTVNYEPKNGRDLHEQEIFKKLLPIMIKSGELKTIDLDRCLYASGLWYIAEYKKEYKARCSNQFSYPSVLNNNYIVGNKEKEQRAIASKHWFYGKGKCLNWEKTLAAAMETFGAKIHQIRNTKSNTFYKKDGDSVMAIPSDLISKLQQEFDETSKSAKVEMLNGKDRRPSYPFITGDGFRSACKFRCEDEYDGCSFSPSEVSDGSCIFVATTNLKTFSSTSKYLHALANIMHEISAEFNVVTHNGDSSTPDGDDWHVGEGTVWTEQFSHLLSTPNLKMWLASNCHWKGSLQSKPTKLVCIPLGIENRYNAIGHAPQKYFYWMKRRAQVQATKKLLVSFTADARKPFRAPALAALNAPWITRKNFASHEAWYTAVQDHKFVACPIGHGYDTHRVWEVLLGGSIPIVESTTMNSMYENLPVLIVNEWSAVTIELLDTVYSQFLHREDFLVDKLFFSYWSKRYGLTRGVTIDQIETRTLSKDRIHFIRECKYLATDEQKECIKKSELIDTEYKTETKRIFDQASQSVRENWHNWRGFDFSHEQDEKVLAFTICVQGDSVSNIETKKTARKATSAIDIQNLCHVQLEAMKLWGREHGITFRQVTDDLGGTMHRAPHWLKVVFAHAFLSLDFDIVFFLDADAVVADVSWNIREYTDAIIPRKELKLWTATDDTVDWHSTGELIFRKHNVTMSFLQDWYRMSEPFFGTTVPDIALRKETAGLSTNPYHFKNQENSPMGKSAPLKRCNSYEIYHEQGCLGQFYRVSSHYKKYLSIVNADRFRTIFLGASATPILHACCRNRKEQANMLASCVQHMEKTLNARQSRKSEKIRQDPSKTASAMSNVLTGIPKIVIVTASKTYSEMQFMQHQYARKHMVPWHWCQSKPGAGHHVKPRCLLDAAKANPEIEWLYWMDGDSTVNPRFWGIPPTFFLSNIKDDIIWVASDSQDMNTGTFFVRNRHDGHAMLRQWQDRIDSGIFSWSDQHAMRSIIVDTIIHRIDPSTTATYTSCGGPRWSPSKCDQVSCQLLKPVLNGFRCGGSLALISPSSLTQPFYFLPQTYPNFAPPYYHLETRTKDAFLWHPAGASGLGLARFAQRPTDKKILEAWYNEMGGEVTKQRTYNEFFRSIYNDSNSEK